MKRKFFSLQVLVAALGTLSCLCSAQAASAAQSKSPLPDWSGSWTRQASELPFIEFKKYNAKFTPSAAAKIERAARGMATGDLSEPGIYCQPFRFVGDNGGRIDTFEFLMTPERTTLINERGLVRRIYTDGRPMPDRAIDADAGFSVGRWEKGALLVTTKHLNPDARFPNELFAGSPTLGKGAVIVERMFLVSDDVLQIDTELTAPELLEAPYKTSFTYKRDRQHVPEGESFCVREDRSVDLATGQQHLDMTPPDDLPPPPVE